MGLFILYGLVINYDTKEVIVAVLDTPVDQTHPLLKGKVLEGLDLVHENTRKAKEHGTHVAGIIARVEPKAKILPIAILGDQKKQRLLPETAVGIVYAVIKGADVINMSFAQDAKDPFTYLALKFAACKGVTLVAAAGNDGANQVAYPSHFKDVIPVGAYDEKSHLIYEESNYSNKTIYAAPGVWVKSAAPGGGYQEKSGTSMSAGYLSGVIAHLKKEDPTISPKEIKHSLNQASNLVYNKRSKMLAVDIKKVYALEANKPYVWLSGYKNYTSQSVETIVLHTANIQKAVLRSEQDEKSIPLQGKITLPLHEGVTFYELVLTDRKGHTHTKDISYVYDPNEPILTVKRVRLGGQPALKVKVDSWTIKDVTLNEIEWSVHTVGIRFHTVYFLIDPSQNTYTLHAENHLGKKATYQYSTQ